MIRITDDEGHVYRSKMEAARFGNMEGTFWLESLQMSGVSRDDITDEVRRFRVLFVDPMLKARKEEQ